MANRTKPSKKTPTSPVSGESWPKPEIRVVQVRDLAAQKYVAVVVDDKVRQYATPE
jgi:hypothetical protein